MPDVDWQSGTPASKHRARRVLEGALDDWLAADVAPLTITAGWPLDVPVSTSELWATLVSCAVRTGEMVARWSHVSRDRSGGSESLELHAHAARQEIARLAAALLMELGPYVDRDAVLAEAREFVDEVDDEDDGMTHAVDGIASLLQTRWLCVQDAIDPPPAELARAAVAILSPLLAQYACVLTRRHDD